MRGKPHTSHANLIICRNIPAYVGKTIAGRPSDLREAEHPRVCGENGVTHWRKNLEQGTSPRMRGKLPTLVRASGAWRNIPAYAGKTMPMIRTSTGWEEHPRVCGENGLTITWGRTNLGTSPRMRGKLLFQGRIDRISRNIPAYAGKTLYGNPRGHYCQEHPRVCGENRICDCCSSPMAGTSPRMRGKQGIRPWPDAENRNIPAYAGKTRCSPHGH